MASSLTKWPDVKANAVRERRDRVPGKTMTIITSFTDSQPLHGWENVHAIREIWQNFRDGLHARFGPSVVMRRAGDERVYEARHGNRVVGRLDCSQNDRFHLTQYECVLPIDCLDLATTKHTEGAIGGHGEGFKLGINLLLCQGFSVVYSMAFERWTFVLRRVRGNRHSNMCVDIEVAGDSDALDITIRGPGAHELFDPKLDLDLYLPRYEVTCDGGPHGQILEADADMHGRVYCRRLFVGFDPDLRELNLGVNLNVPVARDRHLVPSGTWPAIQSILQSVCDAHRGKPLAAKALAAASPAFQHLLALLASGTDHQFRKQLSFVKPALRSYAAIQNGVLDSQVIFCGNPINSSLKVLKEIGFAAIHPAGALADSQDLDQLTCGFIDQAPAMAETMLPERAGRALAALKNLVSALGQSVDTPVPHIVVKAFSGAVAAYLPKGFGNHPFRLIIEARMLESDDELAYCVQDCGRVLINSFQQFHEQAKLISRIVADFIRHPYAFEARRYRIATTAEQQKPTLVAPSASQPTAGRANSAAKTHTPGVAAAVANNDAAWACFHPAQFTRSSSLDVRDLRVSDALPPLQTDFSKHPHLSIPSAGADALGCSSFDGVLCPIPMDTLDELIIYIDSTRLEQLTTLLGGEPMAELTPALPAIVAATKHVQADIVRAMPPPFTISDLPIIYVAVRPNLLGFTQSGHIYLNVVPLALAKHDAAALRQEIFLTIAHELTHRCHHSHDTQFADTLARLVCLLRNCL